MSNLVKKAYEVARTAHRGQFDKAGVDYIEHPKTVASFVKTEEEKAVAYLHDVLEDTSLTIEDLERFGFPKVVLHAVDVLTKRRGQSYQIYLEEVKKNNLARVVKLADLKHNSDLTRLQTITDKDLERREKYQLAIEFLNS